MTCGVIVFAKAPRPGRVKTRLIERLGADGAAQLAHTMLAHALDQAVTADVGPVTLCVGGDSRHAGVRALAARHGVAVEPQGRGGLGLRMARALQRMRGRVPHAVLMGTDAPALDATCLRAAAHALTVADAVFVPTVDGGYALVGVATEATALFDRMRWSHADVMQDTRARARAAGLRWRELPAVHDIDTPADLVHLPAGWRS